MNIGIIGYGVVGGATGKVLSKCHNIFPYDRFKSPYNSNFNLSKIVQECNIIFICVPTPMKPSGEMDYHAIHDSILELIKEYDKQKIDPSQTIIIIRSTAVSGTTNELALKYPFKFAFNPEFLTEKNAMQDMEKTDRVVIGTNDEETKNKILDVYKPLFPNARYICVSSKEAETIKYVANVFLASQIGIANEIYHICKALNVDYNIVKESILLDSRIGKNINVPGHDGDFGFGGKCFPKDLNALIYLAREHHYRPHLLEEVWRLNEKVRKNKDWLDIPGATSQNKDFKKD